jgi:uncharacterized protein YycO
MKNFHINKYNLRPADRIVTPKSGLKLVQHHAIYLGQNFQGIDLIIENKIGHGVRVVTADSFFSECQTVTRIERFNGTGPQREKAIKRALDKIGRPYSLIDFNCESFANLVQHNKIESRQSNTGLGLGLLALGLLIAGAATVGGKRK